MPITRRLFLQGLAGSLFLAGEQKTGPEPQWTKVHALRSPDPTAAPYPVLADIDSHLPATGLLSSASFRDPDLGHWAHEGTHGVNSLVRNARGADVNAVYCLGSRAAIIKEPKPVTLQDVAAYVPNVLRTGRYAFSVANGRAAIDWQKQPLYVLDEWCSYQNGSLQRLEMVRRRQPIGDGSSTLRFTAEFAMFSLAVAMAIHAAEQKGRLKYDHTQLRRTMAWLWNRMMQLFADAARYGSAFTDPIAYYRIFTSSKECKDWRQWCRGYFSDAWASSVMRLSSD